MKSKGLAYFFLIFLGPFGAHKFYLQKYGLGFLYLCSFGLFGIGLFVDLFTLGKQVDIYNLQLGYRNEPYYDEDYPPPYPQQVNNSRNINVNVNIGRNQPQEQLRECAGCGSLLPLNHRFCPNCGEPIRVQSQAYGSDIRPVTVIEQNERMESEY